MTIKDLYDEIREIGNQFNSWSIPMDKEVHLELQENNTVKIIMKLGSDKKEVYRIDILKKAKEYLKTTKVSGICPALYASFEYYNIHMDYILEYYIPKFNMNNARKFGANILNTGWWWKPYRFCILSGRRRYLNWLIRQYKNDKTNLREL